MANLQPESYEALKEIQKIEIDVGSDIHILAKVMICCTQVLAHEIAGVRTVIHNSKF